LGFFVVALIAAVLGFSGIALAAAGIAKILFYIFLVLFLVSLVSHLLRRTWVGSVRALESMERGRDRNQLGSVEGSMGGRTILGIALVVIGLFALAYQGLTYTTQKKVLDIGPIQATKEEHHTIPLPPILGALALVGGIVVVVSDRRGN
jgi:uncharacterized membrane protein YtjA (UPF0391 family)